jgi:hypothetical protein
MSMAVSTICASDKLFPHLLNYVTLWSPEEVAESISYNMKRAKMNGNRKTSFCSLEFMSLKASYLIETLCIFLGTRLLT